MFVCLATTTLVFERSLDHDFVLIDDNVHLIENPFLNPPSWQKTQAFWRSPFLGLYVPLTYSLWAAEAKLAYRPAPPRAHLVPGVFHLTSLALHLVNVALAFSLVWLLFRSPVAAAIGALPFAVHPMQVEAVAWASAQKDLLAGLFGLIMLVAWVISSKRRVKGESWRLAYVIALVAQIAALLAKPSSVTLGIVAFALDVGWTRTPWRRSLALCLPFLVLSAPFLWITKALQPDLHVGPSAAIGFPERIVVAFDTIGFYLAKILLPFGLCPDYSRSPVALLKSPIVYLTWLVPVCLGFLMARRLRGSGAGLLAVGFLAILLPVLGLVPFYFQVFSTVADRYAYLAVLMPGILIAGIAVHARPNRAAVVFGILALIWGTLSQRQLGNWQSSLHLFVHTLTVNPASLLAHNNLGTILESMGRLDDAYFHYQQSSRIAPETLPPLYNMARIHAMKDELDEAKGLFQKVLERQPDLAEAHQSLAKIFTREGNKKEAAKHNARLRQLLPRQSGG